MFDFAETITLLKEESPLELPITSTPRFEPVVGIKGTTINCAHHLSKSMLVPVLPTEVWCMDNLLAFNASGESPDKRNLRLIIKVDSAEVIYLMSHDAVSNLIEETVAVNAKIGIGVKIDVIGDKFARAVRLKVDPLSLLQL